MIAAALAALWMMLEPPPAATPGATPASAPTPDVVQTQPQPAPASPPAAQPAPGPVQPDSQSEEPQTAQQPDILGEGALAQQEWEARLHAAYDNAEARQGPLDGRWQITGANGDALFVLVLSDPDGGNLVGSWRDLRRGGGVDGSSYLSLVERTADGVYVRFTESGQSTDTVIELRPSADGRWDGDLTESGAEQSVTMTRF